MSKKLEYVRGKSANRAFFYSDHSRVILKSLHQLSARMIKHSKNGTYLRKLPNERSIKWFTKSGISHCHTYIKLFEHLLFTKYWWKWWKYFATTFIIIPLLPQDIYSCMFHIQANISQFLPVVSDPSLPRWLCLEIYCQEQRKIHFWKWYFRFSCNEL